MKVVLVVDVFPKVSTTFIAAKFIALVDQGIDAHVVCWTSEPDMWERVATLASRPELARRVHVVPSPVKPWTALGPALARKGSTGPGDTRRRRLRSGAGLVRAGLAEGRGFDAWLDGLDPDLVHFEFGARAARCLSSERPFGRPVVVSFRGYDLNCQGLDQADYYDGVWKRADALHLLGDDLWRRAVRRGCPPDKPHLLIPPAVDTGFFSPAESGRVGRPATDSAGTPERPLRVLSVGRLHWKKGSEWALESVRRLLDAGVAVDYRIVGHGRDAEVVTACVDDLGLRDSVTLLGSRRRPEVRAELARADVFLHAAVSEGFCNAVMEAQAMEVPVVCSDADGLGENVADGISGFVVGRRDAAAMADRLATLAADGSLRQRMGEAGRARVAGRFRPEDQIEAFVRLYRAVYTADLAGLTPSAAPSPAGG